MRRGEIQIYETILVIFFFVVIFVFGFLFFYKFTLEGIRSDNLDYEEFKSRQLISYIPSMYELRCSSMLAEVECIDLGKISGFKKVSTAYFDIFGYKRVIIKEVYPGNAQDFIIYEKIPVKYKSKEVISSPLSIYSPKDDSYKVAKLIIEWYH